MNEEIHFCDYYAQIFLMIINYPESDELELLEKDHEYEVSKAKETFQNEDELNYVLSNIEKRYSNYIFDFIKEKVAKENPVFFNNRINELNEALAENLQIAKNLQMVVPSNDTRLKMEDYYNNYNIAIAKILEWQLSQEES